VTFLRLASPLWLLALVAVVGAIWYAKRRGRGTVSYSSLAPLEGAPVTLAQRVARLLPVVRFAALALVVVALARPQRGLEEFRIRTEGIAIVMAIDRSGSMQALDFELDGRRANRLAVVKRVFRDFVEGSGELGGRPDDLIGLVSFGGFAEDRCPLTLDHGALLQALDAVVIPQPIVDADGRLVDEKLYQESLATAIGDALGLSVERLKDAKAKSRVVILLSDGDNTAGVLDPLDAARAAKELGVRVHTIGVGSNGRVPFPARDAFGNDFLVQREVTMDEATLKEIASLTGGRYWNARDTDALAQVYAEIDSLERTEIEGALYTDYQELYRLLVLPALGLLLLEATLAATRLRTLP
jgi:Ca-activated chloride channel family protein